MLVHKGGQINNVQLITGLRIAEMSRLQIAVSSVQRMEVIVKMLKKGEKVRGEGGGMCTKNGSYCEKEKKVSVCVCVCGGGGGGGGGGSGYM